MLRTTVVLALRLNTAEGDHTAGTARLETIHRFASPTLNLSDDVPPSRYHYYALPKQPPPALPSQSSNKYSATTTKFTTTELEPSKSQKVLYESSENEDMTQRSSPSTSVRPTRPRFKIKKQARPHIDASHLRPRLQADIRSAQKIFPSAT
jgi:hypothetical protein